MFTNPYLAPTTATAAISLTLAVMNRDLYFRLFGASAEECNAKNGHVFCNRRDRSWNVMYGVDDVHAHPACIHIGASA